MKKIGFLIMLICFILCMNTLSFAAVYPRTLNALNIINKAAEEMK